MCHKYFLVNYESTKLHIYLKFLYRVSNNYRNFFSLSVILTDTFIPECVDCGNLLAWFYHGLKETAYCDLVLRSICRATRRYGCGVDSVIEIVKAVHDENRTDVFIESKSEGIDLLTSYLVNFEVIRYYFGQIKNSENSKLSLSSVGFRKYGNEKTSRATWRISWKNCATSISMIYLILVPKPMSKEKSNWLYSAYFCGRRSKMTTKSTWSSCWNGYHILSKWG